MRAAGLRYPGVHYWSIWDEPNQVASLSPQWLPDPRDPQRFVPTSPQIYRRLVDAAWGALQQLSGHAHDTILIGETAPKGLLDVRGIDRSMDAQRFIRELYCVDDNLQFRMGVDAQLRGCPTTNQTAGFVAAHPGLFSASGWAHHPYELTRAPDQPPTQPDSWLTMGNLRRLGALLRRIRERYNQPSSVPLYLTRYGYETGADGVSPARQAEYLNHAEYLAWRNGTVRTLAQFLLIDAPPVQSGLRTATGARKPAYDAYALPVWLPAPTVSRGGRLSVWGLVRAAPDGRRVQVSIQVRKGPGHPWQRVARRPDDRRAGLSERVGARAHVRRAAARVERAPQPRGGVPGAVVSHTRTMSTAPKAVKSAS